MNATKLTLAVLLSAALAACSAYETRAASPATLTNGVLTGSNGMTLYTFDKDSPDSSKSVCNDACASNWPPFFAMSSDAASGDFTVITRDDGKKQWALKGKPLYYWVKDQKPGDRTGDGVNKVWHVVTP